MTVIQGTPPPPAPLSKTAVMALVNLRELLKGELGDRTQQLAEGYSLKERWLAQLAVHDVSTRLEALETLAVMRFPENFTPLMKQLSIPQPAHLRPLVAMTAARSLAKVPPGEEQEAAIRQFASVLINTGLPQGVLEETLALAEDSAPRLLAHLLDHERLPSSLLRASLSVAGWLKLNTLGPSVARYINHFSPRIRAVTLRSLTQLEYAPTTIHGVIMANQHDRDESVRIQAIRAMVLLPLELIESALWNALADSSWWVRQAAGMTLLRCGSEGHQLLDRAALSHPDPLAAQIAAETILNRDALLRPLADEWIWART